MTEIAWYPPEPALEATKAIDVAAQRCKHIVDLMLDMSLATSLEARFRTPQSNYIEDELEEVLVDPNVVLGLGDGGAHLAQLCDANYATYFLQRWVRERKAFSLEQGVQRLTSHCAGIYGITDRGKLSIGWPADLVVFDPETVGPGSLERVYDLPAGNERLISRPRGISAVIVNGMVLPAVGEALEQGKWPGKLLRHGHAGNAR
jgi:N-acyl-D-aspartate/D-glutamate deacylase